MQLMGGCLGLQREDWGTCGRSRGPSQADLPWEGLQFKAGQVWEQRVVR